MKNSPTLPPSLKRNQYVFGSLLECRNHELGLGEGNMCISIAELKANQERGGAQFLHSWSADAARGNLTALKTQII